MEPETAHGYGPGRGNKRDYNVSSLSEPKHGNRSTYLISRLKRDAQSSPTAAELLERIKSGELSAHKAAVEAGYEGPGAAFMSHALRTCEVMGQVGEDFFASGHKNYNFFMRIANSRTTLDQKRALMWKLTEDMSQQQAAERIGWSREAVKDYKALQNINEEAWKVIGATFLDLPENDDEDIAPKNGASRPFTAGLLRSILDLSAGQQLTLCRKLARGKDKKGRAEIAKSQSEEFHHHGILDSR